MLVKQHPEIGFDKDRVLRLDVDESGSGLRQLFRRRQTLLPASAFTGVPGTVISGVTVATTTATTTTTAGGRRRGGGATETVQLGGEVVTQSAAWQGVGQNFLEKRLLIVEMRRRRTTLSCGTWQRGRQGRR